MDSLVATSYLLSYRYGVSSRSFVATIIDIITNGGYISKNFVWHFIFCSSILLSFLVSVLISFVIQKSKDAIKTFVLFLSLLYISCFTAPSSYFVPGNFGRVEIFAFIFMLILIVVIDKPIIRWVIPVLTLFTISTHLILVFFYIPFVGIMLLYNLLKKEKPQWNSLFLLGITILLAAVGLLLYVMFHEQTFVFQNAHDFFVYLKTKSDIGFDEDLLYMTVFAKLQNHLDRWHSTVALDYGGNINVIINIPLIVLFVVFWIKCLIQEEKKSMKVFFSLPVLTLVYQGVAFFMFFDFGRWMIMILNIQFMLIFYLVYVQNETVLSMVQKIVPCIKRHWFIIILICILMTFLGTVNPMRPPSKVSRIARLLLLGE